MSRYIKLRDLQKFPIRINHYDQKNGNEHFVYGVESILEYAEYLPAADVVEVVRCKDCIHRRTPDCSLWYGTVDDFDYIRDMGDNFYCSLGERNEDETEEP